MHLLSLRAQLRLSSGTTKPKITETLAPPEVAKEGGSSTAAIEEGNRCVAVSWLPQSEGALFLVAYASGSICTFKKAAVVGEGGGSGSKFSLGLGSSKKDLTPSNTFAAVGSGGSGSGGICDASLSPDGRLLAVACRDGAVRLLDALTGAVTGGFRSYFGAPTCCSFSPDGR